MTQQKEFLIHLCENNQDAIIVGSIGTISYDMTDIPHPNKILIRGAMGAAMGCGLGIALNTDKQVIVVIGDGSFLMCMGSVSTIIKYLMNHWNIKVIVINNNSYKSCGGQTTNFLSVKSLLENIPNLEIHEIICK